MLFEEFTRHLKSMAKKVDNFLDTLWLLFNCIMVIMKYIIKPLHAS